uniref:Protein shisa-like-2A n=1 Tax=Labrus bergylta TaxID=56723 RepID=A0A3Q3E2L7_9LABR
MSSSCESYYSKENVLVGGFTCPKADMTARHFFCCGFSDLKYCCDDPNSFFPYEYGYMWWLSLGALVGLSVAALVLLAFIITLCVLCYLFITTKPRGLDNGLPLRTMNWITFNVSVWRNNLLAEVCLTVSYRCVIPKYNYGQLYSSVHVFMSSYAPTHLCCWTSGSKPGTGALEFVENTKARLGLIEVNTHKSKSTPYPVI